MHTPAYLHTFIGCKKHLCSHKHYKFKNWMKGMIYNVVFPCLSSLYVHGRHCHPPSYTFTAGRQKYREQSLTTTRALENVSWPQKKGMMLWLHFPEAYPPGSSAPCCGPCLLMSPRLNVTVGWGQRLSECLQQQKEQQLSVSGRQQNNSHDWTMTLKNLRDPVQLLCTEHQGHIMTPLEQSPNTRNWKAWCKTIV